MLLTNIGKNHFFIDIHNVFGNIWIGENIMGDKVSVIIPVFNGSKYLEETVRSCANQSHENLEILILDDKSSDNCEAIFKEIIKIDKRIKIFMNERNLGFLKTANKGIKMCSGSYIIVLGQDDVLKINHIEIMLKEFDEVTGAVFCKSTLINENGNIINSNEQEEFEAIVDVFRLSLGNAINSCGLLMKKSIIEQVAYYEEFVDFPNYGEWYLWIKIVNVSNIKFCNNIKSLYRRHSSNMTNSFQEKNTMKKLHPYFKTCRKLAYKLGDFSIYQKLIYWYKYTRYELGYIRRMFI